MLEHGIETGIIKRLPHGEFIEVHQPLAGVDDHGHAIPLEYQGASVPQKMNQLGMGGAPVPGSLLTPDPPEETAALARARAELAARGGGAQRLTTRFSARRWPPVAGRPSPTDPEIAADPRSTGSHPFGPPVAYRATGGPFA